MIYKSTVNEYNTLIEQQPLLTIIDTLIEAMIIIDTSGIVLFFNQAAQLMFGHRQIDVLGCNVRMLMPSPFNVEHDSYINNYLRSGKKKVIGVGRKTTALRSNGDMFPVHLSVGEIFNHGRQLFVAVVREQLVTTQCENLITQHSIDEQLSVEHKPLARANQLSLFKEMAAGIAHEISQPLTAISVYANTAERLLAAKKLDALLDIMPKLITQARRAGDAIGKIQELASHEALVHYHYNCGRLIHESIALLRTDLSEQGIILTCDLDDSLPRVRCNPIQIKQLILNLLSNSIDAIHLLGQNAHAEIQIRSFVNKQQDHVVVSICDTGVGVSETQVACIFDPFWSSNKAGLGMGLPICKSIIEAHDGQLGFYNNSDDGATFYFQLPIKP